tara:strand:+ start:1234 stop:1440 length:207 start_codon:yes stop_codon:yes gene_type:complete
LFEGEFFLLSAAAFASPQILFSLSEERLLILSDTFSCSVTLSSTHFFDAFTAAGWLGMIEGKTGQYVH